MERYKVAIVPPGGQHADPLAQSVSVIVIDRDMHTMLAPDGTWVTLTEGAAIDKPTLALPAEVMDALIDAVDRYRGAPSHAKTEAAVLREWLAKEQSRVDSTLGWLLKVCTKSGCSHLHYVTTVQS